MKKRYWAILVLLFLVGLDWFIRVPDSRSRQLTAAIEAQASTNLKNYTYRFWVMKVDGETAVVSSPRSVEVPALKALGVLYPDSNTRDPNDPAFIAAELMLGQVQTEARSIVLTQPGIKNVRWELDRDWLVAHHVEIPQN